ncbi:MAG TPA: hypothetical protein H9750_04075 [Candidatus Mediterraneibacter excrementavium]|nr:hypothetical protein [Candidatus Mediterraneibacter excrementavium]
MREWKKPEVKIFDVKMDENIAASGDQTGFLYHANPATTGGGWVYWDGANYRYSSNGNIQDTGIYVIDYEGDNLINKAYVSQVSGCLA